MSQNAQNQTRAPRRLWRELAVPLGLLVLFVAGVVSLAAATGWDATMAELALLSPAKLALLLALSFTNYICRALRWHNFAGALGFGTTLRQNLRHFFGGFAMTVTPGRLGELVRLRWIHRETGWSYERAAPIALVDRAADVLALAVLLGAAIVFSTVGIAGAIWVSIAALIVAVAVTRPGIVSAIVTYLYRASGLWPRVFARARVGARSLRIFSEPMVLGPTLAVGLIGWLAEGYAFYILLKWLGADIGLGTATAVFIFAMLAGGLTGLPGGVGGAEGAMIALLLTLGVPIEIALPATAVIRVTTLWFAIAIGIVVFPFAEHQSQRRRDALEHD